MGRRNYAWDLKEEKETQEQDLMNRINSLMRKIMDEEA